MILLVLYKTMFIWIFFGFCCIVCKDLPFVKPQLLMSRKEMQNILGVIVI